MGKHNILLVEDDPANQELISSCLQAELMNCTIASTGSEALQQLQNNTFDLILLDLILPDYNGLDLLKIIHNDLPQIPVIIISQHSATTKKVIGFELGADDYVTKPFDEDILVARIRANIRRAGMERKVRSKKERFGEFEVYPQLLKVYKNKKELSLSGLQFRLLYLLMQHNGRLVGYDTLKKEIWAAQHVSDNCISNTIFKLRIIINDNHKSPVYIFAIRGRGYKFMLPDSSEG